MVVLVFLMTAIPVLYCIYLSFSMKQRSTIIGTISSIESNPDVGFHTSFEMIVGSVQPLDQYTAGKPYYNYSRIDLATDVLERDEFLSVSTVIKKSLFQYPNVGTDEIFSSGLSYLAADLTIRRTAFPYPIPVPFSSPPRTHIHMEIISLGSMFIQSLQNETSFGDETQYITPYKTLLNISAHLTLSRNSSRTLFLEGLYDPLVGKMYLIGCRDVRAFWEVVELEDGFDCLVEAAITYPPTTSRWLVSRTGTISISSQRNEDDPLYFKPIKLQTYPLTYQQQRDDFRLWKGVEYSLRIITLSVTVICILSQIFYRRDNLKTVPFISLVMLAVQAIGYGFLLITGTEMLLGSDQSKKDEFIDLYKING